MSRPLFLSRSTRFRRRARRTAAMLAIAVGTVGTVLSMFFAIGYLVGKHPL